MDELTIQAFNKRILGWFPWLDKAQTNASLLAPEKHRFTGKFSTIITGNFVPITSLFNEKAEESGYCRPLMETENN